MNKKGYTLAEALVTLGIIGIIAALVVPAANKARPNENKMKFLQTYDAIETQIKNFTQNSRYFPTCQDFNDENGVRCFPDYPLYNTSGGVDDILVSTQDSDRPLPANYDPMTDGPYKLCYLLADAMDGNVQIGDNVCTFRTPNGVSFAMEVLQGNRFEDRPSMVTNIAFDVNGNVLQNADRNQLNLFDVENNNNIQDISIFLLYVFSDGSIIPGDTASAYYLATRKTTRDSNITNADIQRVVRDKYSDIFIKNDNIENMVNNKNTDSRCYFSN